MNRPFGLTSHRSRLSGRHRQPDRWTHVVHLACAGSSCLIAGTIVATFGVRALGLALLLASVVVVFVVVGDASSE